MGRRRRLSNLTADRPYNQLSQCGNKFRHKNREAALLESVRLESENPGEKFDPYRCPHCNYYHVGHTTKRLTNKAVYGLLSEIRKTGW